MKFITHLFLAFSLIGLTVLTSSCEETKCASIVCQNGGTCDDGLCDCPPGTSGEFCQNLLTIQNRLDNGETPLDIVNSGTPVEDLYGEFYAGGLIFFVDVNDDFPDMKGMVVAELDQSEGVAWGCRGDNLPIPDVFYANNRMQGGSYELGTGKSSTQTIVANCSSSAAALSNDLNFNGPDWFLPSAAALDLIQERLARRGLGNFTDGVFYWSSSESSRDTAVAIHLRPSHRRTFSSKNGLRYIRSVRTF